jgi:hypothetical protein
MKISCVSLHANSIKKKKKFMNYGFYFFMSKTATKKKNKHKKRTFMKSVKPTFMN